MTDFLTYGIKRIHPQTIDKEFNFNYQPQRVLLLEAIENIN